MLFSEIKKYLSHLPTCNHESMSGHKDFDCTCGLEAVEKRLKWTFGHDLGSSHGERYPCPKCGSTDITHTLTESYCNNCDYNSND